MLHNADRNFLSQVRCTQLVQGWIIVRPDFSRLLSAGGGEVCLTVQALDMQVDVRVGLFGSCATVNSNNAM